MCVGLSSRVGVLPREAFLCLWIFRMYFFACRILYPHVGLFLAASWNCFLSHVSLFFVACWDFCVVTSWVAFVERWVVFSASWVFFLHV